MIPILLEIQGLYSYRENQTIEFDKLTAAGLFGIFGAVGSGKSSILEAILLALYGSTERLSDRGEKNSMLNLQSGLLLINFEFRAGKNNANTYLARYAAKRNPRNFDEVRPAEHTFYEKNADSWIPLSQKADELVGMKKEHFKQTVIIPQGKFREFIDLTPGPRAEMMKELFGLERFDLSGKTTALLKTSREEKIRLDTQLSVLAEYNDQLIEDKSTRLEKLSSQVEEVGTRLKTTEEEARRKEILRGKHQQLQHFRNDRESLRLELPAMEKKKVLYREYTKAMTHLKPIRDQLRESRVEFEKYATSTIDCERFKVRIAAEVAALELEEQKLKEKNNDRPARESKIRDLKKVTEIKELLLRLDEANKKSELLRPEIESKKTRIKGIELKIREIEEEIEAAGIPSHEELATWKSMAKEWETGQKLRDELLQEVSRLSTFRAEVQEKISTVSKKLPSAQESPESWIEKQKNRILSIEKERDKILGKKGLASHVHLLHQGEPCPLCGSLAHPSPLEAVADEQELAETNKKLSQARSHLEETLALVRELAELAIHLDNHTANLQSKQGEMTRLTAGLDRITSQWQELDIPTEKELASRIQAAELAFQNRDAKMQELKSLRKEVASVREALEQTDKNFQEAEQIKLSVGTGISTKTEEIKDPGFCTPFYDKSPETIRQTISNVEKDIRITLEELEGKQKHLREKRAEEVKNLADLRNFSELKVQTEEKINRLEAMFDSLKEIHGFGDGQALEDLFEYTWDAEKVDTEIRQFEQKLGTTESRIKELESEQGVSGFSEEDFIQLSAKLQLLKSAHESAQHESVLLQQEIRESTKKLGEKSMLEKALNLLQNRESYLKELDNLFRGSGFVKYVSTIYLKELCNTANVRFMKLSKNSLSLEIDDDNTFWVIDYLNGGKRRLLKTLSGGQTFQASLCLALALAEKVKSLNQADQSFFFLDEGFGALDRNSLRVVFETLKSLRHENRIVGIISHVEELQQEIGVYAQIELDPDRGSQVHYSF